MDLAIQGGLIRKYDDIQRDFHLTYFNRCGNDRLRACTSQLQRCFIKRDYETVDQETACKLLNKANNEHAHILELFEARDATGVRDYVRDVHSTQKTPSSPSGREATRDNVGLSLAPAPPRNSSVFLRPQGMILFWQRQRKPVRASKVP